MDWGRCSMMFPAPPVISWVVPEGAGTNERNAILLSVVNEAPVGRRTRVSATNRARTVHFGFADSTTLVLHKFGFGSNDTPFAFDEWRENLLLPAEASIETAGVTPVQFPVNGMRFELAQRNTPPLWGLGEIERAAGRGFRSRPTAPTRSGCSLFREEFRDRQAEETPWITGRIPRTSSGQEGWFGWRGQTDTLRNFVLNACANELGLEVPGHPQPGSPADSPRERHVEARERRLDLTDAQCRSLTAFVEQLPRPQQVYPESPGELARIRAGELVFDRAGCTDCHVPTFAGITGFYSDMLLHNMGDALADRASANPELEFIGGTGGGSSYSGGGSSSSLARTRTRALPCECENEWKTPPLWGVADSAPYLHDGRAATLEDAILMHDGEGAPARYAYELLPEAERWHLLAFLESLRAPLVEEQTASD